MSDVAAMLEKADWVEELQRKVFEECEAQKSKSSVSKSSPDGDVPILIIIDNVHRSFAQVPLFRQRSDFLEELRKSLHEVGRNGHVNWCEFRESSERWFLNLVNLIQQDGNNNIRINHSDTPTEDSEKDGLSVEERSGSDANDDDRHLHSMNQLDTVESSYSLNSSSMGFGATDSMMESSEDTDHPNGDIAGIDLEVRIRRYNEETAGLREDLLKAEETVLNLERELIVTKTALERMTNRFNDMKKENDDQKESLNEAERRNELCKQHLRKLEKAQVALEQKSRELDVQKENIANLKARIDGLAKENSEYAKQLNECRVKYDEKIIEYEDLQERYKELENDNSKLEKSFERNIQHHKEKIQELQNQCADLQSKMNGSDTSSRFSLTPPPYSQALTHVHSTPYSNRLRHQDSLFNELKASGYNIDEAKVQDLKHELSFYNEEIAAIAEQVDEALQEIAASRNEICVPNVHLVESDSVQMLKQKITTLINLVKTYTSAPSTALSQNESPRQKPDILPTELKKTICQSDDRVFAKENREYDFIGSVTSTIPSITVSRISENSSSLEVSALPDESESSAEQEVIVPISEALTRINELKEADEETFKEKFKLPSRILKPKPTFVLARSPKYSSMKDISITPTELAGNKAGSNLKANADVYAMGDGPHIDLIRKNNLNNSKPQVDTTTDVKTPNSFKDYRPSPNETYRKLDTRYVTIRPSEETYVLDGVVSSTVEKFELGQFNDMKPETTTYYPTPLQATKLAPRRKLSVYTRSFDVDSLQTPDSPQTAEKRRSISTPDVQESEFPGFKSKTSFDASVTKSQLLSTYRCNNTSDSFGSPFPSKNESSTTENEDDDSYEVKKEPIKLSKPVVLAPTKFKLPDSTVNQTISSQQTTPVKQLTRTYSENYEAHQSKILSGSLDILKRQLSLGRCNNVATANTDLDSRGGDKLSNEQTNSPTTEVPSGERSTDSPNVSSDSVFIPGAENHKTYTKEDKPDTIKDDTKSASPSASRVNEEGDRSVVVAGSSDESSSSSSVPAVKLVMSSGEDSSAESECEPRQQQQQPQLLSTLVVDEKPPLTSPANTRPRSNSCVETLNCSDSVNKTPIVINGDDKENSCQKITSNSLSQETTKLDESPKAFPSLTDQRLREAGISNYNDIETEIKESLSEEELKKKYTAFSVGLGADRMTLSKRITLSRRFRDQDEKNLQMEVSKMEESIRDLAPLCIDSESVAKVEQAKQDLEMISRCASRISRSAETLGAVQEERRVSRAVLLADKYLQTLRAKCEKLAHELVETKKILAENNIMLEENVSEMGDDVPKVRYRAVLSNNRTMMARRRASIATISRPLMGSNQDISKEPPRQRNSVSGRVPTLRRPSLSCDPRYELEKLDRTDSSNSIIELREIHEQAESRRHSREENNNSIRASSTNLALIPHESIDDQVELSNAREDEAAELENDNEVNTSMSLDLLQHHRHPLVCQVLNTVAAWRPMLCGLFIAFFIGFFCSRVISVSESNVVPNSWWSIEEILNQYAQVENGKSAVPRPV